MKNTLSTKISVIIPVYNVSKYLYRCFDSVIAQTYKNLEIILVDDGSTDESREMCDKLVTLDNRVSVIHQPNGGLSAARNTGISAATGDFIVFWDSDDWVEEELLERAIQEQLKCNSDIVVWGYVADFVDSNDKLLGSNITTLTKCEYRRNEKFSQIQQPHMVGAMGYAWNKLYRFSLIKNNNLFFDKGLSLVEDILFNVKAFRLANRISFCSLIGNHYMQRQRVTLGVKYYPDYLELKIRARKAQEEILRICQISESDIFSFCTQSDLHIFWNTVKNIVKSSLSETEKREEVKKLYLHADLIDNIRHFKPISIKDKFKKTLILFASSRLLIHITNLI